MRRHIIPSALTITTVSRPCFADALGKATTHDAQPVSAAPGPVQKIEGAISLSAQEKNQLQECEMVIGKGWQTFVEVGRALATIRDNGLYRDGYATFEAYCRQRWQFGRAYAYRLIAAAEVVMNLSPLVNTGPTSEFQVRPLIGLEKEDAVKVWQKATAEARGGTVTANLVKKAAAEFKPKGSPGNRLPHKTLNRPGSRSGFAKLKMALELLKEVEEGVRSGKDPKAILELLARVKMCLQEVLGA